MTGRQQARLDQLAAEAADAADAHGVKSREHDAAMDAHAEFEAEVRDDGGWAGRGFTELNAESALEPEAGS